MPGPALASPSAGPPCAPLAASHKSPMPPTWVRPSRPPKSRPSAQAKGPRCLASAWVLSPLCLPCLPALCVTPTPGRRGAQPETSPVGPWEYGRCTRKSRDFHRQLRAEACGRRPLSRGGGDQGPGARASPAPPSGLSGPAGADYGQISEETWAYLHDLYGGGPEVAIRQGVAQLQDPESFHGEQKIEAETRGL